MRLSYKLLIPLVFLVVLLGSINYLIVHSKLKKMKYFISHTLAEHKAQEIYNDIEILSHQALRQASLFALLPEVIEAFKVAHYGNIDDEKDPSCQRAREMLRQALKDNLSSFKKIMGVPFKLHYHLPNGHSLVRLWRKKQAKRNGIWVDISDDISPFRQTVLDVNKNGKPIGGIELGRGGFVIRGLVPIKSNGKQLGSAEVLLDFDPLIKSISKSAKEDVFLFMNADKLSITTRLHDPNKYPVINNEFVLVSGDRNKGYFPLITPAFLSQGKKHLYVKNIKNMSLVAIPIKDYKGDQIGVLVYEYDIKDVVKSISTISMTISMVLVALILLPGIFIYFLVHVFVSKPINEIVSIIRDITEDRADLNKRLSVKTRDEIGLLAKWFNLLMDKIYSIMQNIEQYRYVLEMISDPIFVVDKDCNITFANQAVAKIVGKKSGEDVKGMKCRNIFNTDRCSSERCPVEQIKKLNTSFESETMEVQIDGEKRFIKPRVDIMRDLNNNISGYILLAYNVTEMVKKEEKLVEHFKKIEHINENVKKVSMELVDMTTELSEQVEHVAEGTQTQKERVMETATAMEQMNSTIIDVAQNASRASSQVNETMGKAEQGAEIVSQVVESIEQMYELSGVLKKNMDELGEQAESIGEVMNVISDIADQTNLLALNAAIEAARAGEAGRGFAVVADEVRKLAEKTMASTKQVGEAVESIQRGIGRNIDNSEKAAKAVEKAKELSNLAGESLREIVELVKESSIQVANIATAAEEQSATSEEINRAISKISTISSEVAESMEFSAQKLSDLLEIAEKLKRVIDS